MSASTPTTPTDLRKIQGDQVANLSEAAKMKAAVREQDKLDAQLENESDALALQELEDEMAEKEAAIQTEPSAEASPPPTSFQYHVCVVASIKGDNIFSDALVNVPKSVESSEDISALRNAMAQQLGALPARVTIVTFQYVTSVFA